jgi:hypothetical protein
MRGFSTAVWKRSLRARSHGQLDQAYGRLGISRSTAYDRLRRGQKRAGEFVSVDDLTDYLTSQAPTR